MPQGVERTASDAEQIKAILYYARHGFRCSDYSGHAFKPQPKPIQTGCFTGYAGSLLRLYGLVPCPDCVAWPLVQHLVQVNRIQDLLMARAENTPNQGRDCAAERATPA